MKSPLLTHVIVARNDNYLGNFKYRLELAVNYTCNSAADSGNIDRYELLIVDWNSETPLREALNLNQNARQCCFFVEVPPALVREHKPSDSNVDTPTATNVGIRRAESEMILFSPADVFFPCQAIKALFDLLEGGTPFPVDIHDCYAGIERFCIPWQSSQLLTIETIDRYCTLHTPSLEPHVRWHAISGAEGGVLVSKKTYEKLQGYNESYVHWGSTDIEFARRVGQTSPLVKLTHAGVFCYDLSQKPVLRKSLRRNIDVVTESAIRNDETWGLGHLKLSKKPALFLPDVINTDGTDVRSYDTSIFANEDSPRRQFTAMHFLQKVTPLSAAQPFTMAASFFDLFLKVSRKLIKKDQWLREIAHYAFFDKTLQSWLTANGDNSVVFRPALGEEGLRNTFLRKVLDEGIHKIQNRWSLEDINAALCIAAVIGWQRPRRYFCFPGRDLYVSLSAAMVEPTLEITVYDHWQNASRRSDEVSWGLSGVNYKGYCHLLTGAKETVFERLHAGQYIGEPYQVMFWNLDFMRDHLADLYRRSEPLMDSSCTIICKGRPKNHGIVQSTLHGFTLVGQLSDLAVYNRVTERDCHAS